MATPFTEDTLYRTLRGVYSDKLKNKTTVIAQFQWSEDDLARAKATDYKIFNTVLARLKKQSAPKLKPKQKPEPIEQPTQEEDAQQSDYVQPSQYSPGQSPSEQSSASNKVPNLSKAYGQKKTVQQILGDFLANRRQYHTSNLTHFPKRIGQISLTGRAPTTLTPQLASLATQLVNRIKFISTNKVALSSQVDDVNSTKWNRMPHSKYDIKKKVWQLIDPSTNSVISMNMNPNPIKNAQIKSRAYDKLGKTVGLSVVKQFASPMLQMADNLFKSLGYASFGAISQHGVPMYIGRYYDTNSKRLRTFAKPNYLYNKNSWDDSMQFVMAKLGYKWNQFVRIVQQATNLFENKGRWQNIVKKRESQNKLPNLRKLQMKRLLTSLNTNQGLPSKMYSSATKENKRFLDEGLKTWDYSKVTSAMSVISQDYLKANPDMSIMQRQQVERYVNFNQTPVLKKLMYDELAGKNAGYILPAYKKRDLIDSIKATQKFKKEANKTDINTYFKNGIPIKAKKLKQLVKDVDDQEEIDVKPAPFPKRQIGQGDFGDVSSTYDQTPFEQLSAKQQSK